MSDSELTSLSSSASESEDQLDSSEDEEYNRKKKRKSGKGKDKGKGGKGKGKGKDDGGYKLKNALKVPRATTYTAQALHDQMHSEDIDVAPEYQREVVWPETKQIKLIDSVFRNFYIPPIIFAVATDSDGIEKKVCIDGKQRLTSIQRFMDGLIPHKDPDTDEKLWFKDSPLPSSSTSASTRKKRLLPDKYRRLFSNKQIVCVEYSDITPKDEREIFQRVQLGMALTPAEKLQVISTGRSKFIRDVVNRFLYGGEDGDEKDERGGGLGGGYLEWEKSRGSDFRCMAQAVYCMDVWRGTGKGQGKDLKSAGSIPILEKWLSVDTKFTSAFEERVAKSFETFVDLAKDEKTNWCLREGDGRGTKVSPIEFILIALGVDVLRERPGMELDVLARAIGNMRTEVRAKHDDVRMNDRCAKTMFEFLRKVEADGPSALAGASSKSKSTSASKSSKSTSSKPAASGSTSKPSSAKPTGSKEKGRRLSTARPASKGGVRDLPAASPSTSTAATPTTSGKRKRAVAASEESGVDDDEQVDQLDHESSRGSTKAPEHAHPKKKAALSPVAASASASASSSKNTTPASASVGLPDTPSVGTKPIPAAMKAVMEAKAKLERSRQQAEAHDREREMREREKARTGVGLGLNVPTSASTAAIGSSGSTAGAGASSGSSFASGSIGVGTTGAGRGTSNNTQTPTPVGTPRVGNYVPSFVSNPPQSAPSQNGTSTSTTMAPAPTGPRATPPLPTSASGLYPSTLPQRPASAASNGSRPMSMSSSPVPGHASNAGATSSYNGPAVPMGGGYYPPPPPPGSAPAYSGSGGWYAGQTGGYPGHGQGGSSTYGGGGRYDREGERDRGRDWERDRGGGRYGRR